MSAANDIAPPAEPKSWRAAVDEAARVFKRGDVIARAWLEAAFGVDAEQDTMLFLSMVGPFKVALAEHHRMYCVPHGGFELLITTARDQDTVGLTRYLRNERPLRRELERALKYVEESELTPQEQKRLNDNRARISAFLETTERSIEDLTRAALPAGGEKE